MIHRQSITTMKTMLFILPLIGLSLCVTIGMAPLALAQTTSPSQGNPKPSLTNTVKRLEVQLKKNPDNIKLRSHLAQVYASAPGHETQIIQTLNPYAEEISINDQLVLASAYKQLKKHQDEVRILKKVVAKAPKNHEAHYILGHAHNQAGEQTEAINCFRQVIKLNKAYRPAYDSLLTIFDQNKNMYESRNIIKDMIHQFGKDPDLLSHICRLDSMDGYLESAIKNCRAAIRKNPTHPDNHVYLAQSLSDKKKESQAAIVLKNAARKFPQSEFVQWATAQYYMRNQNFPVAAKYFKMAVKADQKSARSILGYAEASFELKKYDVALQAFSSACELDDSATDKIREASGRLRQKGQKDWSRKYSRQSYECRKH
jgi:tetratricopeptide (TPR) repeat protein